MRDEFYPDINLVCRRDQPFIAIAKTEWFYTVQFLLYTVGDTRTEKEIVEVVFRRKIWYRNPMEPKKSVSLAIGGAILLVTLSIYVTHGHAPSRTATALQKELLAAEDAIPTQSGKNGFLKQSNNLTQKVDPELVDLDSQIITCDPSVDGLLSHTPSSGGSCVSATGNAIESIQGKYLGGQCCSALADTKKYHENLEKLRAYKSMPDIPLDPMHTPVAMAKKWIDFDNRTTLTPAEQKIYDEAYAMSLEKPCCCKCWHYYTNEGIAKKMIQDGTFNAQEIATYWDSSDICGA